MTKTQAQAIAGTLSGGIFRMDRHSLKCLCRECRDKSYMRERALELARGLAGIEEDEQMKTKAEKLNQVVRDGIRILPLWRCTRAAPYQADCPGRNDTRSRQGYYIAAANEGEARRQMQDMFPNDTYGFTAELWKENVL